MRRLYIFSALTLLAVFIISSCHSYRQINASQEEIFANEEIIQAIGGYDIYTHRGGSSYKIVDPEFRNNKITGKLVAADTIKRDKAGSKASFNDIDIFLKEPDATASHGFDASSTAEISKDDISKIQMYASSRKDSFKKSAVGAGAILLAVLIFVLIIFGIGLSVAGSASGSAASGSGTSTSGTSDSDSGNSNTGCYIATMVYGNYDAPEVMVLRRFRDNTLSRSAAGRAFIRWYYSWSPGFVKRYQRYTFVHRTARFFLDRLVNHLRRKG